MKTLIASFLFLMVCNKNLIAQNQKTDSIYYILPKGIDQLIEAGFQNFEKFVKKEDHLFYLLILPNKSDSTLILLTYCDSGFIYWMNKNSNRFYKMANKTILPIVFRADFDYGVNPANPTPVSMNIGGYEMYIFRNKAIKGRGIIQ